jgi:hypothetical protein
MYSKSFIDGFEEIRDLDQERQLELLEQARIAVFSKLGLGGRAVLYMALSVVLGFFITAVATTFTGLVFMPIWVVLGVYVSVLFYQRMMKGLLHRGLVSVLEEGVA